MEDFVYFQITKDYIPFRYFGLKENAWIPQQQYTEQFSSMQKFLIEKNIYVHDDVQKTSKLL